MPTVIEQVDKLTVSEKMRLVEHLINSIRVVVVQQEKALPRRIGSCKGRWRLPTWDEDRALDREIESEFEMSR